MNGEINYYIFIARPHKRDNQLVRAIFNNGQVKNKHLKINTFLKMLIQVYKSKANNQRKSICPRRDISQNSGTTDGKKQHKTNAQYIMVSSHKNTIFHLK